MMTRNRRPVRPGTHVHIRDVMKATEKEATVAGTLYQTDEYYPYTEAEVVPGLPVFGDAVRCFPGGFGGIDRRSFSHCHHAGRLISPFSVFYAFGRTPWPEDA